MPDPRIAMLLLSGIVAFASSDAGAVACRTDGQPLKPLLELYTSEGCSSCPPADRWLSRQLRSSPSPALVALAWHVDYWDYIGWKDRFADPRFAQRQRSRAGSAGERVVYTPQVMLGDDVRVDWRRLDWTAHAERLATEGPPLQLQLGAALKDGGVDVELALAPATAIESPPLQLELVLYSDGLSSRVSAGENRNVELHHDRVVRGWLGPWPLSPARRDPLNVHIPLPQEPGSAVGVVAIVSDPSGSGTLWALDLPLAPCGGG